MTSTYQEEVPDDIDKTQEEWEKLSYHAQYYHVNDLREHQRKGSNRRRREKREMVNRIQAEVGCRNCDETAVPALVWHHVSEEEKEDTVTELVSTNKSVERIKDEIKKCIVLCANCHRKLHAGLIEVSENDRKIY